MGSSSVRKSATVIHGCTTYINAVQHTCMQSHSMCQSIAVASVSAAARDAAHCARAPLPLHAAAPRNERSARDGAQARAKSDGGGGNRVLGAAGHLELADTLDGADALKLGAGHHEIHVRRGRVHLPNVPRGSELGARARGSCSMGTGSRLPAQSARNDPWGSVDRRQARSTAPAAHSCCSGASGGGAPARHPLRGLRSARVAVLA